MYLQAEPPTKSTPVFRPFCLTHDLVCLSPSLSFSSSSRVWVTPRSIPWRALTLFRESVLSLCVSSVVSFTTTLAQNPYSSLLAALIFLLVLDL